MELRDAVRSPKSALSQALLSSSDGVAGPCDNYSTVLFLLMDREFRRSPNKRKAILIWELFLEGNYGGTGNYVLKPTGMGPFAIQLSLLEKNLEAGGGVSREDMTAMRLKMANVIHAYNAATKLSAWKRFKSSKSRKFESLEGVNIEIFQPAIEKVLPLLSIVGNPRFLKQGVGDLGRKIQAMQPQLSTLVEYAGFKASNLGLK